LMTRLMQLHTALCQDKINIKFVVMKEWFLLDLCFLGCCTVYIGSWLLIFLENM
jgi:hypothetical protein